ncbi:hypothetical protein EDB80DRAFT_770558 [Ilyonectria destructans]|nr:hypothetical protein EDB80DRAFT_770558 [Ilyonectria destructans]
MPAMMAWLGLAFWLRRLEPEPAETGPAIGEASDRSVFTCPLLHQQHQKSTGYVRTCSLNPDLNTKHDLAVGLEVKRRILTGKFKTSERRLDMSNFQLNLALVAVHWENTLDLQGLSPPDAKRVLMRVVERETMMLCRVHETPWAECCWCYDAVDAGLTSATRGLACRWMCQRDEQRHSKADTNCQKLPEKRRRGEGGELRSPQRGASSVDKAEDAGASRQVAELIVSLPSCGFGHTIGWNDLAGTADKTELKVVVEGSTDPVPSAKAIAQHCGETRDMSRPAHATDTRKRQPVKSAPVLNAGMMHDVVRWLQELFVAGWHGPRKVGEMRGDEGR